MENEHGSTSSEREIRAPPDLMKKKLVGRKECPAVHESKEDAEPMKTVALI